MLAQQSKTHSFIKGSFKSTVLFKWSNDHSLGNIGLSHSYYDRDATNLTLPPPHMVPATTRTRDHELAHGIPHRWATPLGAGIVIILLRWFSCINTGIVFLLLIKQRLIKILLSLSRIDIVLWVLIFFWKSSLSLTSYWRIITYCIFNHKEPKENLVVYLTSLS